MTKFSPVSLAGAKKAGSRALRKLFGRQQQPVETSNSGSSSSTTTEVNNDGQVASTATTTTPSPQHHRATDSLPPSTNGTMAGMTVQPAMPLKKENQDPKLVKTAAPLATPASIPAPVEAAELAVPLSRLSLSEEPKETTAARAPIDQEHAHEPLDPVVEEERRKHLVFIEEALDMARLALRINETPVGCVLVHNDKIIARGMNATNVTRNGTRHAEFMALCALFSRPPKYGPKTARLKPPMPPKPVSDDDETSTCDSSHLHEGNEDGAKGHLYPYGQKLLLDERVDRAIISECILYVTVEPCVMCASLLRQLGIKKVYFGAVNDKFGGTGGVFSIHANSLPVSTDGTTASAHPVPPLTRLPDGRIILGTSYPEGGGDGGNVEPGYEIEGGWGRDEAVGLLRRFYVQENGRAPVPRKKEGRAARLAAMMEGDGVSTTSESVAGVDMPETPLEGGGGEGLEER